jgi:DNA-binding beta-propeller fold protein YncE
VVIRTVVAVIACTLISTGVVAQKGSRAAGGNGTFYVGTYAGNILIIDEATERVTGEIKLKTGIPRSLSLSEDRTKFLVLDATFQHLEIVDIAKRATIDSFTLSEPNTRVRVRGVALDPLSRFVILLTRTATKRIDRWEIGPSTMLQYDLKTHAVVRTIPWPKGEEREFMNVRFSPDGKLMYFFGEDILIYDTADFREVDTWEISKPVEVGAGRLDFGSTDDFNEERGFFTGLFYMQDPVQKRRLMGIGRVNLAAKEIDFYTLGPAQPRMSFALAPGRQKAYGLLQEIGRYEFWTFDLAGRRVQNRTEFPGRPRMDLTVSTNGTLLYVWQAGNTIDIYDAGTYKYLRTITLGADTTTRMFLIPASASRPATDR